MGASHCTRTSATRQARAVPDRRLCALGLRSTGAPASCDCTVVRVAALHDHPLVPLVARIAGSGRVQPRRQCGMLPCAVRVRRCRRGVRSVPGLPGTAGAGLGVSGHPAPSGKGQSLRSRPPARQPRPLTSANHSTSPSSSSPSPPSSTYGQSGTGGPRQEALGGWSRPAGPGQVG